MRKTIFVIAIIAGLYSNSLADLGDTDNESKKRYGSPERTEDDITWWAPKGANTTWIGETFYHNQCVAIYYVPVQGQSISENVIWRLLTINSKPGAVWNEYQRDSSDAKYANQDSTLFAKFNFTSGVLRICYTTHLRRQGLLQPPLAAANHKNNEDKESTIKLDGFDAFSGELGDH
ncbi:MAG: hypothetical protein JO025_01930 [Verrucomicrobia bacterium]|nr:hypothetical protein [Verrucomicrobiota bacterium]